MAYFRERSPQYSVLTTTRCDTEVENALPARSGGLAHESCWAIYYFTCTCLETTAGTGIPVCAGRDMAMTSSAGVISKFIRTNFAEYCRKIIVRRCITVKKNSQAKLCQSVKRTDTRHIDVHRSEASHHRQKGLSLLDIATSATPAGAASVAAPARTEMRTRVHTAVEGFPESPLLKLLHVCAHHVSPPLCRS